MLKLTFISLDVFEAKISELGVKPNLDKKVHFLHFRENHQKFNPNMYTYPEEVKRSFCL